MKYLLVKILIILIIGSPVLAENGPQVLEDGKSTLDHTFITGQWVETNSYNKLKNRDLSDPHPFKQLQTVFLTCYKKGKPFIDDYLVIHGYLIQKGDYYEYKNEHSTTKLQFLVSEKDTTLTVEYTFQNDEPTVFSLTKAPRAKSCGAKPVPGVQMTNGIHDCYNYYYFEGEYQVFDIKNEATSQVSIVPEFEISGLPGANRYSLSTFGSHLMLRFIEIVESDDPFGGVENIQYLVLLAVENGFDLHKTNYSGKGSTSERKYQVLDKVYEFRRK